MFNKLQKNIFITGGEKIFFIKKVNYLTVIETVVETDEPSGQV